MAGKLSAKQEMFCREYIIDLNATQAAIRAGYSEKSADKIGAQLLGKKGVSEFVGQLLSKRSAKTEINAQYVLNRLAEIDQMDVIDILNDDLSIKPLSQWPKSWRTTLSGLDISEIGAGSDVTAVIKKIKWPDKVKNLELLGKHVDVKAFERDAVIVNNTNNIMPVPTADSVESWEESAEKLHAGL